MYKKYRGKVKQTVSAGLFLGHNVVVYQTIKRNRPNRQFYVESFSKDTPLSFRVNKEGKDFYFKELITQIEEKLSNGLIVTKQDYYLSYPIIQGTISVSYGSKTIEISSSVKCSKQDFFTHLEGIEILKKKLFLKASDITQKGIDDYFNGCNDTLDKIISLSNELKQNLPNSNVVGSILVKKFLEQSLTKLQEVNNKYINK